MDSKFSTTPQNTFDLQALVVLAQFFSEIQIEIVGSFRARKMNVTAIVAGAGG